MPPPDRWENYTSLGKVIEGTKIVCCKVPLKHGLLRQVPEEEKFSPSILVGQLKETGHDLGLVIDLTFTKKYYNSSEFTGRGIKYEKIFTKGHEVPSDSVFGRFALVIDEFLEQNQESDSVIAVHCTHGVNRTGYLVCRYMVERHKFEPDDALKAFNAARGHSVERENYISDLKLRTPGEKTVYDPNAPEEEDVPSESTSAARRSRFPQTKEEVENSYSKLLAEHQPRGQWYSRPRDRYPDQERQSYRDRERHSYHGSNREGYRNSNWGHAQGEQWDQYNGHDSYYGNDYNYGNHGNQQWRNFEGNRSIERHRYRNQSYNNSNFDYNDSRHVRQDRYNDSHSSSRTYMRNNSHDRRTDKYWDWGDESDRYQSNGWSNDRRSKAQQGYYGQDKR